MGASPENALLIRHRRQETERIVKLLEETEGDIEAMDDIHYAEDYLSRVSTSLTPADERANKPIQPDDMVAIFSIDGAQLYAMKASDTWFFIWILFDLPPTARYKKHYVLPGGVIGGPKKPKNIDSFLFPGLYHLTAQG